MKPVAWGYYLRTCTRTTGGMVAMAVFLRDERLAFSFARSGATAARMLGWWSQERDVPAEAFENATKED
jgi:hypothetical protein